MNIERMAQMVNSGNAPVGGVNAFESARAREISSSRQEGSLEEKAANQAQREEALLSMVEAPGKGAAAEKPEEIPSKTDVALLSAQGEESAINAAAPLLSPTAGALISVDIIHTNDIHGAITPKEGPDGTRRGGIAQVASTVKNIEKQSDGSSLLLDGGDWGQGSYESKLTKGRIMIEAMNSLRYDAAEIGNHEFDWGRLALSDMIEQAEFPILGANIIENGGLLEDVQPYIIKEVNHIKFGIIGVISEETSGATDPKTIEGLSFESARKTVEKYLPELKDQGVDITVVLSHQGVRNDEKLARMVPGIDVIVGGHSHTELETPKIVKDTLIIQAGTGGEVVGDLRLSIDPVTKEILSHTYRLVPVNDKELPPDPEITKIITPVIEQAARLLQEIVGESQVDLTHDRQKVLETVLGNVVTDAMRESTGCDIAMENSGGIRSEIQSGKITFGDLYRVLPFDKNIITLDLTGSQVKEILESSADRKKGNMQVSGITMNIDSSQESGDMVSDIKVGGSPLIMEKTYRVAIDDFLAGGANGYKTFLEGKNPQYGDLLIDALRTYMEKHSPLTKDTARIEGRLNFVGVLPRTLL